VITNLVKKLIVPPLASGPVSTVISNFLSPHVPVFLVHQLVHEKSQGNGITPDYLRRCLRYLVDNGHQFLSLEDAILALKNNEPLPKKAVVFTMDDGYHEQMTVAAPIFLEFDCPVTFFVITDMLDKSLWPWDARIAWLINNSPRRTLNIQFDDETLKLDIGTTNKKHLARARVRDYIKETDAENIDTELQQLAIAAGIDLPETTPPLYDTANWELARELEKQGVRFAPHSKTHRILSKMSAESAKHEIEHAWQRLNEELSRPLNVFCYPTGRLYDFGPREKTLLRENGFIGAVSTIPGYLATSGNEKPDLFSLPRFDLPGSMTDFMQYCTWIEHAKTSAGINRHL
jgi:peptidoglycan/xylan/chitin deacetylase (PgdA/CDA1 family)